MKKTLHAMLRCYSFQCLHNDLVVVYLYISFRIDRRQFMLCRSHFVMLGLGSYSQFPEFLIYMFHICRNSLADSSQIVVIQLLPFRRHGSKKSPACKHQVFSSAEHLLADQEIFLFCPNRRNHPFRSGIAKKPYQAKGLSAYCLHGAEKRGLLVQSLPCVGAKGCRNTESCSCRIMSYKSRGSAVPGSIASGLESSPQTSGWKRRSIWLSLYQFLS